MANTFITMQNIARQTLMRLQDNLVMPNLCYKDFSSDFSDMGDTIQVKKPVVLNAQKFTDGSPVSREDMKETSVPVKLDTIATVDVAWGALEGATNLNEAKLQRDFIDPAAVALAETMNADGMALYAKLSHAIGTAGTTPSALSNFSAIRKFLNVQKAPLTGRRAVWDVEADAKLSEISGLTSVSDAGTPQTLREGEIGRLYGLDNYMSQSVKSHTGSTLTVGGTGASALKVKTAVTTASNECILVSDASASGTLSGSVKAGDVITFGSGATAYNRVVAAAATAASNEIEVEFNDVRTVAQNVAASLPKTFTANLAFHQNAIAFVTRPLMLPKGVEAYVATDSENGISVRVFRGFNTETKKEVMTMDVLYGYAIVYPELATIYMG